VWYAIYVIFLLNEVSRRVEPLLDPVLEAIAGAFDLTSAAIIVPKMALLGEAA